jgi:hypothetical protein
MILRAKRIWTIDLQCKDTSLTIPARLDLPASVLSTTTIINQIHANCMSGDVLSLLTLLSLLIILSRRGRGRGRDRNFPRHSLYKPRQTHPLFRKHLLLLFLIVIQDFLRMFIDILFHTLVTRCGFLSQDIEWCDKFTARRRRRLNGRKCT